LSQLCEIEEEHARLPSAWTLWKKRTPQNWILHAAHQPNFLV
jgi:hypothetical protein